MNSLGLSLLIHKLGSIVIVPPPIVGITGKASGIQDALDKYFVYALPAAAWGRCENKHICGMFLCGGFSGKAIFFCFCGFVQGEVCLFLGPGWPFISFTLKTQLLVPPSLPPWNSHGMLPWPQLWLQDDATIKTPAAAQAPVPRCPFLLSWAGGEAETTIQAGLQLAAFRTSHRLSSQSQFPFPSASSLH